MRIVNCFLIWLRIKISHTTVLSVLWESHTWKGGLFFNTLRPRQNGRHFADDIFKCIFLNENVWIPIKISLKFVPQGPINNIPALVQIMAWRRPGDKPSFGPMMVRLPTHICVTRPQRVLTEPWLWLTELTVTTAMSKTKAAFMVKIAGDEDQMTTEKQSSGVATEAQTMVYISTDLTDTD